MFTKQSQTARTLLPITFFGILVLLLVIGERLGSLQATPITLDYCKEDSDCTSQTAFCNEHGTCQELIDPLCDCVQQQVLRCTDESGAERLQFCANGCSETTGKAACM